MANLTPPPLPPKIIQVQLGGGLDIPIGTKSPKIRGRGTVQFGPDMIIIRGIRWPFILISLVLAIAATILLQYLFGDVDLVKSSAPLFQITGFPLLLILFHVALRRRITLTLKPSERKAIYDLYRCRGCVQVKDKMWVALWAHDPSQTVVLHDLLNQAFGPNLTFGPLQTRLI